MALHLQSYLNYYKATKEPGYAVLVTGAWGAGKTYQVDKYLPSNERYYVSLFGLRSPDDVHAAVLAEADPTLSKAKTLLTKAEEKAASAGHWTAALGSVVAGSVGALLRKEAAIDRPLVFDDLERSSLRLSDILGVINYYVEHKKCRVIVIANTGKISQKFKGIKEKIIGQTIHLEPDADSALSDFIRKTQPKHVRDFLVNHKDKITTIFRQSECKSLRILKHTVEDLGRLIEAFEPKHLENENAMSELVTFFCAFDLEVRQGRFSDVELNSGRESVVGYYMKMHSTTRNGEKLIKPPFIEAIDRYIGTNLESRILSSETITNILIDGRFDSERIRSDLNNSAYFLEPTSAPAWKIVTGFDSLPDELVEEAYKKMTQQFENREISEPGEMLHIFALGLDLCEQGVINCNRNAFANKCINYIDDMFNLKKLPPASTKPRIERDIIHGHDGFSYWVTPNTKSDFELVFTYLEKKMDERLREQFGEISAELIAYMKTDPDKFMYNVCYAGDANGKYQQVPVLASISPKEFVDTWFSSPNKNWRPIAAGLSARYGTGELERDLAEEKDWFLEVLNLSEIEARKAKGFRSYRIRRVVDPKLTSIRDNLS